MLGFAMWKFKLELALIFFLNFLWGSRSESEITASHLQHGWDLPC